ncbi:protoporphyrinogen oxidase [Limnochorda pilosa]|uniref:Coproporphyrinogen III oxidase n=1 Tax=Limnochorda pilosa TaxID=1555112 RepID=A0A0K2SHH2_LIMPI|nr:protoporphyrinogen oxidase [Limnochorda pilosa]BAS26566.1 protoporphyrinogen oxidase [Limnochorda pilosa]
MTDRSGEALDLVVVGGGVAGLAAAVEATGQTGREGCPLSVAVLEASGRPGGKVLTTEEQGYLVEAGPDSFVTSKPGVLEMARRLGLEKELLPQGTNGSYVWSRGQLHRLPEGLFLLVPSRFLPFVTSSLLSWPGKLRMALDLVIPPRYGEADESLEHFVLRRLGREALERLAEPLVAGIHAGDPATMSVRATFPRFIKMEQQHGGLVRAALAARVEGRRRRRSAAAVRGAAPGPRRTFFMSFRQGLESLPRAMAAALPPGCLRLETRVDRLEPLPAGFRIHLEGGQALETRGLVLATPAAETARLLRPLDPAAADLVASIPQVSTATVTLAYRREQIPRALAGSGFVVPSVEGRKIMGLTYLSRKWPRPQPDPDVEVLRAFVGGAGHQDLVEAPREALVQAVREELRTMLGIEAPPLFARTFAWPRAMHQYTVGHLERVERLEARAAMFPGLALAGAAYRGVGLPDCIESGLQAARKALATSPAPSLVG